jgi:hypothetical protein
MSYLLPYANLAISWGLFILIWLVQLIIYPGFHLITREVFVSYHKWYVVRISSVVLPLMVAELIVTVKWILSDDYSAVSVSTGVLAFIVWLSTAVLQVPIHNQLKTGKDAKLIQRLVATNWIRTAAWSLKAATISLVTLGSIP